MILIATTNFEEGRNQFGIAGHKPMSPFLAVFNGHLNDADKRARNLMRKRCPKYLEKLEHYEQEHKGIMAIFDLFKMPAAFRRYVLLVQTFVNETAAE